MIRQNNRSHQHHALATLEALTEFASASNQCKDPSSRVFQSEAYLADIISATGPRNHNIASI